MNDYGFGNYIYELRKQFGYGQKEVAAFCGVSNKAVSKWENGKTMPKVQLNNRAKGEIMKDLWLALMIILGVVIVGMSIWGLIVAIIGTLKGPLWFVPIATIIAFLAYIKRDEK